MPGLPLPALPDVPEWLALWPWAEASVILFAFAWGAMLGSFINVVIHRVPLGESVVRNPSRCPHCKVAIRARDNLPVVGWLKLGGRCRTCGAGISPAYPLVEGACGLVVAALAAAELVGGGQWLAHSQATFPVGVDRLLRGDWQLLLTFCLHAAAVLTVVTWALFDAAGWKCPVIWLAPPLAIALGVVGLVPLAAPPGLMPDGGGWPARQPQLQGLAASLAGAAVGGLLGRSAAGASVRLGLPLLGSVLGWQTLTIVAVVPACAAGIARCCGRPDLRIGAFGVALAATATLALACQGPVTGAWVGLLTALTSG